MTEGSPTQAPASFLPLLLFLKNPSASEMKKINIKEEMQVTEMLCLFPGATRTSNHDMQEVSCVVLVGES